MNGLNRFTRKALAASFAAASLALASMSVEAVVLADFTVDESSVEGLGGTFVADKINGSYSEVITFTGSNFAASAYGDFTNYLQNDGTDTIAPIQLNSSYGLYATFTAAGTFACGALCTFTGTSASFDLFIDPDLNTTKDLPGDGSGSVTLGSDGDDYLIASASSLVSGVGVLVPGVGGFFDLVFDDFTLTLAGMDYFISPDPFYLRVNVDGDFDTFSPAGTQEVNGDLSAVFQIPEPGSITLLGLALLGLGFSLRRRGAAQA